MERLISFVFENIAGKEENAAYFLIPNRVSKPSWTCGRS